jgi:glycerophosphoryl diester phosphodiesterase
MKVSTFIAGIAALASSVAASAASYDYDPAKVIAAMRRVDPKLKIIIAHRGIYGSQCPENSLCSINRTVETGIEAVEIDVKESQDGIPWPSHDMTAGRGTTYNRNGIFFDPYHKSASNDANNPAISDLSEAQLLRLALRDIDGNVVASNRSMNLRELLYHAARAHNNLVFVFDIKFPQSVRKVAQIAKDLGIGDRVVLKFSATFFSHFRSISKHWGFPLHLPYTPPKWTRLPGSGS